MVKLILQLLVAVVPFFLKRLDRRDQKKAEEKAKVKGDLVGAFKEKDKKTRASRLNTILNDINGMR